MATRKHHRDQFWSLIDFRSGDSRPDWCRDGVTNRTEICLSRWDRVKVLMGWSLEVETFTATENVVGKVDTRSYAAVRRPEWVPRRRQPSCGMIEVQDVV